MTLLAQFVLRLAFGLAVGMTITSSRLVSSGYFRNHLYVTLGLAALAAMATYSAASDVFWYSIGAVVASYFGVVMWLYEKPQSGKISLVLVALFSFLATSAIVLAPRQGHEIRSSVQPVLSESQPTMTAADVAEMDRRKAAQVQSDAGLNALRFFSNITSSLVLGITTAAMLLGHWYLNSPGMELAPLRRLLIAAGIAVGLQATVSTVGLYAAWQAGATMPLHWIGLRWSFGLVGVLALLVMAWQTLKIPNTQSATGILYVAVIGVFIGELAASLLSAESAFPL